MLESLPRLQVVTRADAFRDLEDLLFIREVQFPGESRFQIRFEERTEPSSTRHKAHIDAPSG